MVRKRLLGLLGCAALLFVSGTTWGRQFSVRAKVSKDGRNQKQHSDAYFEVPIHYYAVVDSVLIYSSTTGKVVSKRMGKSVLSERYTGKIVTINKDVKGSKLYSGPYVLRANGDIGTVVRLTYNVFHLKKEILRRSTFILPQGGAPGTEIMFKADTEVIYDENGNVIKGVLDQNTMLHPVGYKGSKLKQPEFAKDSVIVFNERGLVKSGTLARKWTFKTAFGDKKVCPAGTKINLSPNGRLEPPAKKVKKQAK
jgi:hypothetical protein